MSVTEPWTAAFILLALLGSCALGMFVQRILSEHHRSRETTQLVHQVVVMLFTFAALVLGLLITSAKSSFDQVDGTVRSFAVRLIELDQVLREYGSEADSIRNQLRSYAAGTIARTWTEESNLAGNDDSAQLASSARSVDAALEDLSGRIELQIRDLEPKDGKHRRLASDALRRFDSLMQKRWTLIELSRRSISTPFYLVLVFWLVVVFASFGLTTPHNAFTYTVLAVGAVSIASAMFVILDLDRPFSGLFIVPSDPMHDALAHLTR